MHDIEIATHTCCDSINEGIMYFIRLMQAARCSHKLCADSVGLLTAQLDQIISAREDELIGIHA